MTANQKQLLLLEPDAMVRHTVAMTARSIGLAEIHEAARRESAWEKVRRNKFNGFLLALGSDKLELDIVSEIRAGKTPSSPGANVAVLVDQCDQELLQTLRLVGVDQIVVRPFKVKTLLGTIQRIAA